MNGIAYHRLVRAIIFLIRMGFDRWQKKSRSNAQRGQAIVIIVLAMVALLGLTALAIDGGNYYNHRRLAQNAADPGALAGTQMLAGGVPGVAAPSEMDVLKSVHSAAEANGIPDSNGIANDGVNAYVLAFYAQGDGADMSNGQNGANFHCGSAGGDDDQDDDGVGNCMDEDDDNDGIDDEQDDDDDNDGIPDSEDEDDDNDGVGDAEDDDQNCGDDDYDNDGISNAEDSDDDNDGIDDEQDDDDDNDGTDDAHDDDDDNDGTDDAHDDDKKGDDDYDNDGIRNSDDDDDDNDGIDDEHDNDDDNDGIDDEHDNDDDNDGVGDAGDKDNSETDSGQCQGINGGGAVPPTARGVRVIVRYPLGAFLAGFVGRSSFPVEATSTALYEPAEACNGYGVFADNTNGNANTVHFTGSSSTVTGGGIHSNSGIHLGNFTTDVGPVEYDTDDQSNLSNYAGPALTQVAHFPMPQLYDIADFQPPNGTYWLQACADGKCFQSAHLTQIQSDGLYYVDGDVDVGNSETSQAVTIVATGPIKISVRPNVSFRPYLAGLFLFSAQTAPGQPAIDLGGHSPEDNPRGYDGNLYAPYGVIKMSSQNTHEVRGSVFGWEVDFSGSTNIINFHPEYCPPTRAKIFTLK